MNKIALVPIFMELSLARKTYIKQMMTMEENAPVVMKPKIRGAVEW